MLLSIACLAQYSNTLVSKEIDHYKVEKKIKIVTKMTDKLTFDTHHGGIDQEVAAFVKYCKMEARMIVDSCAGTSVRCSRVLAKL